MAPINLKTIMISILKPSSDVVEHFRCNWSIFLNATKTFIVSRGAEYICNYKLPYKKQATGVRSAIR